MDKILGIRCTRFQWIFAGGFLVEGVVSGWGPR